MRVRVGPEVVKWLGGLGQGPQVDLIWDFFMQGPEEVVGDRQLKTIPGWLWAVSDGEVEANHPSLREGDAPHLARFLAEKCGGA